MNHPSGHGERPPGTDPVPSRDHGTPRAKAVLAIRSYLTIVAAFTLARVTLLLAVDGADPDAGLVLESLGFAALLGGYWLAVNWRHAMRRPAADPAATGRGRPDRTGQVIAGITTGVVLGSLVSNVVIAEDATFLRHFLVGTPIVMAACLVAILVFVQLDWPTSEPDDRVAAQPGTGRGPV